MDFAGVPCLECRPMANLKRFVVVVGPETDKRAYVMTAKSEEFLRATLKDVISVKEDLCDRPAERR